MLHMNVLRKLNLILEKFEEFLLSFGIIIITVILVANVFTRSFLSFSIKAAEELSTFLVLIVTFAAVAYAARYGKHIMMTIFLDLIPHKAKKVLMIVNSALCVASLAFLTKITLDYVIYVYTMGRVTPALEMPAWWPVAIMPIGFALGTVQFALAFIKNIRNKDNVYVGPERIYGTIDADEMTL